MRCYKTSATLSFHTDECFSTRHLNVNDDCWLMRNMPLAQ